MPRLKRLTIHKLPRVQPGTELVFNEGHNVLLGLNGSGKTTLLKLISKVCSGVFTFLDDIDFHVSYEIEHAGVSYSIDFRYEPPGPDAGISIRGSGDETFRPVRAPTFAVVLVILRPGDDPIRVEVKDRRVSVSYRDRKSDLADFQSPFEVPLISTIIPLIFNTSGTHIVDVDDLVGVDSRPVDRLDESTQWFQDSFTMGRLYVYEAKGGSHRAEGMVTPFSVMDAVVSRFESGGDRDPLVLQHRELDFLMETVDALGYVGATMRLELLKVPLVVRESRDRPRYAYGRYEFRFTKRDGSRLWPEDLSFGQQRLFAFFYYAAMHRDIVIADELTNGMHHSMIDRCLDVVEGRQTFFATQNPLLLDNLGFASLEDVRKTFIVCSSVEDEDGQEQMIWRNITAEEAENFFRDYEVGISHVNDILRRWGLW